MTQWQKPYTREPPKTKAELREMLAVRDLMSGNIDGLCAERDRLKKKQPGPSKKGKALGGRRW